jgi:hypothetical protein
VPAQWEDDLEEPSARNAKPRPGSALIVAPTPAASTASVASAATATTSATALAGRPGLVHDDVAPHEVLAIQGLNGAVGFLVAVHFDESEAARLARETVTN